MPGDRHGTARLRGSLAVYLEIPYRRDADGYSADRAFVQFLLALRPHVDDLALIGRVREGRAVYPIPDNVSVRELPDYPTLTELGAVVRTVPKTLRALDRAVGAADHLLSIGPHPMSIPAVLIGKARRKDVGLMVRQNYPSYIRHRLPSRRWLPALGLAGVLDAIFRLLARRLPTVVVGRDLVRRYRRSATLLDLTVSLVPGRHMGTHVVRSLESGPVRLLSVGRLDPEKAPHLLIEMMSILESTYGPERFALTVVGTGQLESLLRKEARALSSQIAFLGYVPHGDSLFALYRESDVLVHTALTEGVPQVLIEGQIVGIPIVATAVGGVRAAVADGRAAQLVPPGDASALAAAVETMAFDSDRRAEAIESGLASAGELTLERQVEQLVRFLGESWAP